MKKRWTIAAIIAAGAMIMTSCSKTEKVVKVNGPADGKYNLVVNAYDWGPGADKVIVNVGKSVSEKEVKIEDFGVKVKMQGMDWMTFSLGEISGDRTVTGVYVCDAEGNKTSKDNYVAVELSVHPMDALSNPFVFCPDMMNRWSNPYELTITNASLGIETSSMDRRVSPLADQFTMGKSTLDGITLSYGAWEPAKHGNNTPLIIWLHGMGEGGTDPYLALLGNKVVNLITPEIQKLFGSDGAYVLAPQADGFWLQTSSEKVLDAAEATGPAKSYYTEALFKLIDDYVKANPSIDKNRIYIGGCSNGGYMTMNMIIEYPEYFAAAYPVCEAYPDSKIDEAKIALLKNQHIWFTQAKNDTTVDPNGFTVPTFDRLVKAGASDVHFTFTDDVHDTTGLYKGMDGEPYQYMGHWSWIYTLNNECVENGQSVFEWLSKQHK